MAPFRSRIAGTGSFLPAKRLTNADLEKIVETKDQWIVELTGIKWLCIAEYGVNTSDMAL
jgi:3-oxoacyl-[acyl-carrier-protein] synthase-3